MVGRIKTGIREPGKEGRGDPSYANIHRDEEVSHAAAVFEAVDPSHRPRGGKKPRTGIRRI